MGFVWRIVIGQVRRTPSTHPSSCCTACCRPARACAIWRSSSHSTVRCSFPICEDEGTAIVPEGGYDPPTMADDVAGLIDRLGIERPALIGRLHGGLVAYHLAARRPELVCGVVLGDANPEVTADRASQALAAVSSLPRAFASLCGRHSVLRRGFGTAARPGPP